MSAAGRGAGIASVTVLASTVVLGLLMYSGVLLRSCGGWGLDCLTYAVAILGCGALLGSGLALVSLTQTGWRGWLVG